MNQKLTAAQRDTLINELFLSDKNNIGISYLRMSMGASDLDDHVFSYDDLLPGQTMSRWQNSAWIQTGKI